MQDLINRLEALRTRLDQAWAVLDFVKKKKRVEELEKLTSEPTFWQDQEKAKTVGRELSDLQSAIGSWESLRQRLLDVLEITELDKEDQSVNLRQDVELQTEKLEREFKDKEFELLFSAKYDQSSAIMAIHAGAGGTDAQDWAEMLLRMYLRFCEKQNWPVKIVSTSPGSEAGIKSVVLEIEGSHAYGYLKSEAGVHRLVRISPFDAEKMRHTSFALVELLPVISEDLEIEIKNEDLRVDTYRAGGHGGQSVNTTDSAVRITHLPTGIIASCQNERSQYQNKETAMKVLRSKLQKYYETEVEEEKQRLRGEYTEAAWGNQARSYVLHPYKLVKDHRTDLESVDVEETLDGELLPFMEAFLRSQLK